MFFLTLCFRSRAMASRPSILEEEEDLLKMQREFLAKKQAPHQVAKDVVNLEQAEEPDKPPGIQRKRRFERAVRFFIIIFYHNLILPEICIFNLFVLYLVLLVKLDLY